jgi:serine/threonine protein kinase
MKHAYPNKRRLPGHHHNRPSPGGSFVMGRNVWFLGMLVAVTYVEMILENPQSQMQASRRSGMTINLRNPSAASSQDTSLEQVDNRRWRFLSTVFLDDRNVILDVSAAALYPFLPVLPHEEAETPDFGSLDIFDYDSDDDQHTEDESFGRIIASNDERRLRHERRHMFRDMDEEDVDEYYYRFDERTYPRDCMLPSWTDAQYPTCNTFHEFQLDRMVDSVSFLGQGYYRDSFLFHDSDGEQFVMKHLRIDRRLKMKRIEQIRTEALLLEKFSSSPHFTNIFGYCDTSLFVEVANDFSKQVVPFHPTHQAVRGRLSRTKLEQLQQQQDTQRNDKSMFSLNNFTVEQKLDFAIQMAEALAELHGFDSVIIHNDFDVDNLMITEAGRLVMNDLVSNIEFVVWLYLPQSEPFFLIYLDNMINHRTMLNFLTGTQQSRSTVHTTLITRGTSNMHWIDENWREIMWMRVSTFHRWAMPCLVYSRACGRITNIEKINVQ